MQAACRDRGALANRNSQQTHCGCAEEANVCIHVCIYVCMYVLSMFCVSVDKYLAARESSSRAAAWSSCTRRRSSANGAQKRSAASIELRVRSNSRRLALFDAAATGAVSSIKAASAIVELFGVVVLGLVGKMQWNGRTTFRNGF